MKKLAKAVQAMVTTEGQMNLRIGAILLVAASWPMVGCAETGGTESDQVASASQAMYYGAAKLGCPSSIYVALKSYYGYYCAAGTKGWMTCYSTALSPEAQFAVVDLDDGSGMIALLASDGNYVSATNGGGGGIWHNRPGIGIWESFLPGRHYTGGIYLKTSRTDQTDYVTAENGGGGVMNANRHAIGPWEGFTVQCL